MAPDQELVARFAAAGDEAAFAAIVDRHGPMLLGVCRRETGDGHLAEDALQATFVVLARRARSIRRQGSLAGWLHAVAVRLARKARHAAVVRGRREAVAGQTRQASAAADPAWEELLLLLDEELRRLPDRYRAPLLLCYHEGRTQDEAAKQLGWGLNTVRRRLERGREILRARLTSRGATLGAVLFAGFLAPTTVRAALPEPTRQALVAAGRKGAAVTPAVLALAAAELRRTTLTRLALAGLALLVASVLVAVVVASASGPDDPEPPVPPQAAVFLPNPEGEKVAGDPADAPLPKGAVARVGTLAFRHGRANVYDRSLTFLADGKHLVSMGGGWARTWDLASGEAIVNLGDGWRSGFVDADTLVSEDGKLAVLCRDEPGAERKRWICTVYDLTTGKELHKFVLASGRDLGLLHGYHRHLSPDSKLIVEEVSNHLFLWRTSDGSEALHVEAKEGRFQMAVFARDSRTLFVGDDAGTIHVIDVATGKELRTFGVASVRGVGSMALSPDGKWLLTCAWNDGFLRLWDVATGKEAHTLDFGDSGGVGSMFFTADNSTVVAVVTASKPDGNPGARAVRTWDRATGKAGRAWTESSTLGAVAAVSADGKVLATMTDAGVIRLWDTKSGKEQTKERGSPASLVAVGFGADGKMVYTADSAGAVRAWDAAAGNPAAGAGFTARAKPRFAAGGLLLTETKDETQVTDPATGKVLCTAPGKQGVLSADRKLLATTVGNGDEVHITDVATGKTVKTLTPPAVGETYPGLHPAARGFNAEASQVIIQGAVVSVWDVAAGRERASWSLERAQVLERAKKFQGKTGKKDADTPQVRSVAVSPDGALIAFAVERQKPSEGAGTWVRHSVTVTVLETKTGKTVQRVDVDNEQFGLLVFSPDGKRLAGVGGWTIRVWDVGTDKAAFVFDGHRGPVRALAFSADGRRLASASEDTTVLIWDLAK